MRMQAGNYMYQLDPAVRTQHQDFFLSHVSENWTHEAETGQAKGKQLSSKGSCMLGSGRNRRQEQRMTEEDRSTF